MAGAKCAFVCCMDLVSQLYNVLFIVCTCVAVTFFVYAVIVFAQNIDSLVETS